MHNAKEVIYQDIKLWVELIDGALWRKAFISKNGQPRKAKPLISKDNFNGYYRVYFGGNKRRGIVAQRLIYSLHHQVDIPEGILVDHIDLNPLNNDISNLRLVTNRQNTQNKKSQKRAGALPVGVKRTRSGRFEAQINVSGKRIYLGTFDTIPEASAAYQGSVKTLEALGLK